MFSYLIKGLIIPGHILLSDKNLRGNVTKHTRELCSRGCFGHIFARINPVYDISVYNNIFNYWP